MKPLASLLTLSLLTTAVTTTFGPNARGQEPESAPPQFQLVHSGGELTLKWGEQTVLRELRLTVDGMSKALDEIEFKLVQDGRKLHIQTPGLEGKRKLTGTFALNYDAVPLRLAPPEFGHQLQLKVGRSSSARCDALWAKNLGLALYAPGSLQMDDWKEGGLAEIRLNLSKDAALEIRDYKGPTGAELFESLRPELQRRFADQDGKLPPILDQLCNSKLPAGLQIEGIDQQAPEDWAQVELVNLRIPTLPGQPAFDLLLLLNPRSQNHQQVVDFKQLGWAKAKRKRLVIAYPDGDCLGEIRSSFQTSVPAHGWSLFLARELMPRGVIASSDGPLGALLHPWEWNGLGAAPGGKLSMTVSYKAPALADNSGWLILATADSQVGFMKVISARDEHQNELEFSQDRTWARVQRPAQTSEQRYLEIVFEPGEEI
jgi:hypothetical protein